MSFKSKYFIIYPRTLLDELQLPPGWSFIIPGYMGNLLRDILNVKKIGSEIKLIWNTHHYWQIIKTNNLAPADLDDYLKADCSTLYFETDFMMQKAAKQLKKMGAKTPFVCVDNYRDVILQQANFKRSGQFIQPTSLMPQVPLLQERDLGRGGAGQTK